MSERSLAEAARHGRVLWSLADPVDSGQTWIAVAGKFLYCANRGTEGLLDYGDLLDAPVEQVSLAADQITFKLDQGRGEYRFEISTRKWTKLPMGHS